MKTYKKELLFQVILTLVLYFFYAFRSHHPKLLLSDVFFFINYFSGALLINYVLLSRFLYSKKYVAFIFLTIVVIGYVIVIEEFVIEKIFFPYSRGLEFMGVLISIGEVVPILLIFVSFKFGWDSVHKQLKIEQLDEAVIESQSAFLQTQITPHFLFNSLNNIYAYSFENTKKTSELILGLSDLLRYVIYDSKINKKSMTDELKFIKDFIALNEVQMEGHGKVNLSITDTSTKNLTIAPLIFIVFIENAFKHSTNSLSKKIKIDISFEITDTYIRFKCFNNFTSLSNSTGLSKGIGLKNVKERLNLLYPNCYELTIEEESELYGVQLLINCETL